MARRYRQHVNPYTLRSLAARDPLEIPDGPRVEVELGCGDGLFLVERAVARPSTLFIGIDIRREFLQPGLRRAEELELSNLRLEPANLIVDSAHLFARERVSIFFINFPDPWFKRSQHHRRWLDAGSLEHLVEALREGGEIIYQSDVWDPAIEALGLFEANPRLRNAAGDFTFYKERPALERTSRERACEEEGRKIWRIRFLKA